MNPKSLIPLTLFLLIVDSKTFAQNVAINSTGSTPDTSAMLDISSTTKGLLIPRMTTTQLGNIPTPARGLLAFSTTDSSFKVNLSSTSTPLWTEMLSCATGWAITGNNCANSSPAYLGTTNNKSVRFMTNNIERMVLDSNGRIGLGTVDPTNILSFGGNTARTIWLERNTSTNGANLTIQSGGANAGGSNLSGGDMYIASGTATGTGYSNVYFQTASPGSSGTADNAPSTKMSILGNGNVGIGISPTAVLHLKAGTATANTAPLKFASGVASQTTKEAGAVNYDGNDITLSDATYAYTLTKTISGSATLDFPGIIGSASADLNITVTGAAVGDIVLLGVPNVAISATSSYSAWVSSANTVTVRFSNGALLTPENPASGTFKVRVIK